MALIGVAIPVHPQQDEAAGDDAPARLELDLDEDVLVFTGPLRDDGTIDYIAALNARYSEGVTHQTNVFRELFLLLPQDINDDDWFDDVDQVRETKHMLGITDEELAKGPVLVDWYAHAEDALGLDFDSADELYAQFVEGDSHAEAVKPYLAWIELNEPAFERAAAAVAKPHYWAPIVGDDSGLLISVLLPQYGDHRMLARALQARAYYHAHHTGDFGKVVQAIRTLRRLAYHQSHEPFLIGSLVAISIDALAAQTVQHLLRSQVLPDKTLAEIDALWRARPGRVPVADTLAVGEKCFGLDAYMQILAGRTSWDGLMGGGNGGPDLIGGGVFDVNRGLKHISRRYHQIERVARINNFAGRQRVQAIIEQQFDHEEGMGKLFVEVGDVRLPNPALVTVEQRTDALTGLFMAIITPALSAASNTETRFAATERSTLAAIAVERYRLANVALPATLDALVPDYLDAVPIDPFNNEPLQYKPIDGGYILYAVDENLDDDGGTDRLIDRENGDWVIEIVWDEEAP